VPADPHPRYVVREITGYPMGGGPRTSTSVWVADRWYCCAEVASFPTPSDGGRPEQVSLSARRLAAETVCAEWNAEHDAWLAAG
jgi:hypothetical protein